jgi:hypothetical protein
MALRLPDRAPLPAQDQASRWSDPANLNRSVELLREKKESGADGIRTHDLCIANAALSQLSYGPVRANSRRSSARGKAPPGLISRQISAGARAVLVRSPSWNHLLPRSSSKPGFSACERCQRRSNGHGNRVLKLPAASNAPPPDRGAARKRPAKVTAIRPTSLVLAVQAAETGVKRCCCWPVIE